MALNNATFAAPSLLTIFSYRTLYTGAVEYFGSFLHRNRRVTFGLSVTDLTDSEWCEKQKEFSLTFGGPWKTEPMKAGSARHAALVKEDFSCESGRVIKKVKYRTQSAEDVWALKFMNFIRGANQLLVHGLTRELPLVNLMEGEWVVGRMDEIRKSVSESQNLPTIVETKTRQRATLPAEPQIKNGRFQAMCYKKSWDSIVSDEFPLEEFYNHFSLNPEHILSPDIVKKTKKSGFPCEILHDLVEYFRTTCSLLPPAHDQLLLRYELQGNQSLLMENQFPYDPDWVEGKIKYHLEFLRGEREASCAPVEERWKCNFCPFSSDCPASSNSKQHTVGMARKSNQSTLIDSSFSLAQCYDA